MNIDYKIKKECFKMQVQNEKELIQIPIDMFYPGLCNRKSA